MWGKVSSHLKVQDISSKLLSYLLNGKVEASHRIGLLENPFISVDYKVMTFQTIDLSATLKITFENENTKSKHFKKQLNCALHYSYKYIKVKQISQRVGYVA
jgi:hypothetical protein